MADVDRSPSPGQDRSELALAILAGLATLAFAWAGFQSAQWVRERFLLSDKAAGLSQEALDLSAEADRSEERDTLLYVEWRSAIETGDRELADSIFGLFREEFQQFLNEVPADERGLPLTDPRDDPGYDVVAKANEAKELDRQAAVLTSQSREASSNGARYGMLGLVFAAALAAVGIASRLEHRRTRMGLAGVAAVLLVLALGAVLLVPVTLDLHSG